MKNLEVTFKFILMLLILVIGLQIGIWHGRNLERKENIKEINLYLQSEIDALRHELNKREKALEVIGCESNGRHIGVWGDNGKSLGWLQWQYKSFRHIVNEMGKPELRWTDRDHQLEAFLYAIDNGYEHWWTCFSNKLIWQEV